jgi:hypothetical protein
VKQFLVNPFLTVSDLREGIERQAGYRGMDLDSPHDDYEGLITKVAGDPPSFEKIKSNLKNDIKLSNHEQWLVDLFNSSETGMLHRDSITESALSRGISLGSLAIYLSYLPIVRTAGPAVYCLVGTKFTEKALLGIREGAKDSAKQTEIAFQVVGSTISFEIKPNIGTISSGVVFPPKELVNLIRSHSFTSTCVCQELESEQIIKVSKDGFWVGFSAIFRHAYRDHKIPDDSKLLIKFDLKRNTANIYGNTM